MIQDKPLHAIVLLQEFERSIEIDRLEDKIEATREEILWQKFVRRGGLRRLLSARNS